MVFCTFCGHSNDAKCVIKTRIYPYSAKDVDGKRAERGPICKLCDRKFFVREKVEAKVQLINVSKLSLVEGLKKLESQGNEAKHLLHEEEDSNAFTVNKINEAKQENAETAKEIKKLREDKKNKKRKNN